MGKLSEAIRKTVGITNKRGPGAGTATGECDFDVSRATVMSTDTVHALKEVAFFKTSSNDFDICHLREFTKRNFKGLLRFNSNHTVRCF